MGTQGPVQEWVQMLCSPLSKSTDEWKSQQCHTLTQCSTSWELKELVIWYSPEN
jgi:hypothetical protein